MARGIAQWREFPWITRRIPENRANIVFIYQGIYSERKSDSPHGTRVAHGDLIAGGKNLRRAMLSRSAGCYACFTFLLRFSSLDFRDCNVYETLVQRAIAKCDCRGQSYTIAREETNTLTLNILYVRGYLNIITSCANISTSTFSMNTYTSAAYRLCLITFREI